MMLRRLLVPLVTAVALLVRLHGLGQIMTADEERWMIRSSDFYRAIERGDLGGTHQSTHPGVTLMFLSGLGIKVQELWTRDVFQNEESVGPYRVAAKLPVAVSTALLIGLVAALVGRIGGRQLGIWSGLLLALDPYLLGFSQLVHLDALLSLFMASSLLAFLIWLRGGARRFLILSAFLGGLALLTKLPAVYLFGMLPVAVVFLWHRMVLEGRLRRVVTGLVVWVVVALLTVCTLWPSLWLELRRDARYVRRDVTTVVTASHFTESDVETMNPWFYPRALAAHATGVTIVLSGVALLSFVIPKQRGNGREVFFWVVYVVGFLVCASLIAKRGDRYVLPAHVGLVLLASLSLPLIRRLPRVLGSVVIVGALLTLVILDWTLVPSALAYRNRWFPWREPSQEGWGEGLEGAAAWLNTHPLARELDVATWYPNVFRHFFVGKTFSLSSRDDSRTDYVVLYRNMAGRAMDDPATEVLREFSARQPVHTVTVRGVPTAWIYRTDSGGLFPSNVGELLAGMEVGQTITAEHNGLSGVRLVFATFSSRANTVDVLVHVHQSLESDDDLRTVRLSARDLKDDEWQTIAFDPIPDSVGKTYYLAVTSPAGRPGNAVTLRFQEKDIAPGRMVLLWKPLPRGGSRAAFQRSGDLAVELLYTN